jgi:hypothetical protein
MNGINSAKNGCSYIVMSDRTGTFYRTSNVAGSTAKFFCKNAATGIVEQYTVEVTPSTWTAEGKFVRAVTAEVDVAMCEKHIAIVAKKRERAAKWRAQQAKKEAGK